MSRFNPIVFAGILLVFVGLYGGLPLLKGGLYLDTHEGDAYHFIDIVMRMHAGDVPHLDFMTPLGLMSFLPVAILMDYGYEIGRATILSQLAVAAILLPVVVYTCASRFTPKSGMAFGVFIMTLVVTISYGTSYAGVAISMHYNRWSWAIALTAISLVVLPPRGRHRHALDGTLVGALFAWLLLLKITFFVSLLPIVIFFLLLQKQWSKLLWATIAGLVIVVFVTLVYGVSFWFAYLADLKIVASSRIRPNVGVSLNDVISGPTFIGGTLAGIAFVLLARRTAHDALAIASMFLLLAFTYITYQNFGNDQYWLVFFALILFGMRPEDEDAKLFGMDIRQAMKLAAVASITLIAPALYNTWLSPIKHAAYDEARFVPMLPKETGQQDVFIRKDRGYMITARVFLDQEMDEWSRFGEFVERPAVLSFNGVDFPSCSLMAGSKGSFEAFSERLARIVPNSRLFTADILVAHWLFGPFKAPENGAPWYYGGLTGLENSDYLVIPKCSFVQRVRDEIVAQIDASDYSFELVEDNDLYALFSVTEPTQ